MKKHTATTQTLLPSDYSIPREKLLSTLISYFLKENGKLRLGIEKERISVICKTLLSGNEDGSNSFQKWQIKENTLFDEYRNENLEILDYLHFVSTELKKQLGQYSTPISIVKHILKSVNYVSSRNILSKKLIDPACGSGAFLVEATRVYLNTLKKSKIPLGKRYPMIVSAITGIDIDPKACFFARLNLSILLTSEILEFEAKYGVEEFGPLPVYCVDTLEVFASENSNEKFLYGMLNFTLKNQFDFVVGNPPYFKIRGLGKSLKNTFSDSIYGHPNAYGLFTHTGIEMLKTNGGLGFIVPRSMLSGLYFKNLRNFIERKTSLKEITCISERKNIFDRVLHGTMIISLKRKRYPDGKVNISCVQSLNETNTHNSKITTHRDNIIQHLNGTTVWFVADSSKTYKIINRVIKNHPLLSGNEINFRAKTGQIVWNRFKPLLTETVKPDTLPLVWATDIGKFSFSFNRRGASRPCFLKVSPKTSNLIANGMSILVQRVTADEQPSRIVACIPEGFCKREANGYFVENHLNIIRPIKRSPQIDLYFILGVLNSEIVDFFFRAMNGNTQVSATELNLLPIPIGRYESSIADIAKKIQKTKADKDRSKLINELNVAVAGAYGLNTSALEYINKNLSLRFN